MTGTFGNHRLAPAPCGCVSQSLRTHSTVPRSHPHARSYLRKHLLTRIAVDLRRRHHDGRRPFAPRTAKKAVRFSVANQVVPIQKTTKELYDAWYHPIDYSAFEATRFQSIAAIVRAQGDLSQLDTTEHSLIGLEEQLTRKQIINRRLKTVHYRKLVLERFLRQKKFQPVKEVDDAVANDPLHSLSDMLMRHSAQRAQWRALLGREECAVDANCVPQQF